MTLTLDISGDFVLCTDNLLPIQIYPPVNLDSPAELFPPGDIKPVQIVHSLCQSVTDSEAQKSNGRYQRGDKKWTFPDNEGTPSLGSFVNPGDGSMWTVFDMNHESQMALWRVTARNMVISGRLTDEISIVKETVVKGQGGAAEKTWTNVVASGLAARLQTLSQDRQEFHGRQSGAVRAACYLQNQFIVDNGYRVLDSNNRLWEIEGYADPDSITDLFTLHLMYRL